MLDASLLAALIQPPAGLHQQLFFISFLLFLRQICGGKMGESLKFACSLSELSFLSQQHDAGNCNFNEQVNVFLMLPFITLDAENYCCCQAVRTPLLVCSLPIPHLPSLVTQFFGAFFPFSFFFKIQIKAFPARVFLTTWLATRTKLSFPL